MTDIKTGYYKKQGGFTMLELALVLLISGFSMLMVAEFMRVYTINGRIETTMENTRTSQQALREFFVVQKRYPCPADPTLTPGDAGYGLEQCRSNTDITNNPDDCTTSGPDPFPLECTNQFSRDGDTNGQPDVVMIGILPFRTLYNTVIDTPFVEAHRKDGYGTHLSYAVTEQMTYRSHNLNNPTNPNSGAIRVVDENRISVVIPDDSAHYVLFSHGENGRGGYTQSGTMIDDCLIDSVIIGDPPVEAPPGPFGAGTQIEIENCDNQDAIFVQGIQSLADNDDYNDDILVFNRPERSPLWTRSISPSVPDGESWIHNTNRGFVGVGLTDPEQHLHIDNNLTVEVTASGVEYCGNGADAATCVIPDKIAGSGSNCPDHQAAYAIQNNELVCRDVTWTLPTTQCPPGEHLVGFSNLGNPRCR